ncbi:MAG: hypothetical protein EOM37_14335 [Proteobacteria bacterium]|nr:hypothetical protein [Pseudomonadota bacterium]
MVGFLIIKHLGKLSEEHSVTAWAQSLYFQAFCG